MNVVLGRVSVAAALVLGDLERGAWRATRAEGPRCRPRPGLHGIGFTEPKFRSTLRTGKDQPYTWPVSDRYRPVSQPFYAGPFEPD